MADEMADEVEIENVSDTALWVAVYRAKESERPDALFRDRLAARLVGDRGPKIAKLMQLSGIMEWVMAVRTVAIDRLIHSALKEGVDTVVNLGAGLDTRPYRLELSSNLRWIEVDFPHLIAMKNEKLAGETSNCRLERIALDLTQRKLRRELFAKINGESQQVLLITEGVIPYLKNEDAAALADDLHEQPNFYNWIQDYFNSNWPRPRNVWAKHLKAAPMQFKTEDWFGFFGERGWAPVENIRTIDEAKRVGRPSPQLPFFMKLKWGLRFLLRPKVRRGFRDSAGYVRLQRAPQKQTAAP